MIVSEDVPQSMFDKLSKSDADTGFMKSESIGVDRDQLDEFNESYQEIKLLSVPKKTE